MIKIDIICPLYEAESCIDKLVSSFYLQKEIEINRLIFPVTKSIDKTLEKVKLYTKFYFEVEKEDFCHSIVRERAMHLATSDIVIMITQDVILNDENCFYNLAMCLTGDVVYAFARQKTKYNNIEKYIREKNYPLDSYVVSKDDIPSMQIKAFYCSDACAAYNKKVFMNLNGYDNKKLLISEDMYYARKVLLTGYKTMYCAEAVVQHSHNFSLRQIYKRYYETGEFFRENKEFNEYKKNDSGFSLAFYTLSRAIKDFNIPVIFRWLPDMTCRYFGLKKGLKK